MDKLSSEKIFSKTLKYVFFKMLIPIISLVVSLLSIKIISAITLQIRKGSENPDIANAANGELEIIGTLIWIVITLGFAFGIQFFWGYKFRAAHAAIVTDAVSVGVFPDDMKGMAKESLEYRFPTCNDYFLYSRMVKKAIAQLQKDLNTYAENKMDNPVLGKLISFSQIFIGWALSYTYDLILGYTFWRDGKPLYTSAADGVAIYYNCWKRITRGVMFLAIEIIVGMVVTFVFFGAIGAAVLAPSYGAIAGGLAGAAVGYFICLAAKSCVDSNLMIKTMTPYFEEAQYAEITEDERGTIYRTSPKYAKLYQKSQAELAQEQAQGGY